MSLTQTARPHVGQLSEQYLGLKRRTRPTRTVPHNPNFDKDIVLELVLIPVQVHNHIPMVRIPQSKVRLSGRKTIIPTF